MTLPLRLLGADDESVLHDVAPDVFAGPVNPRWSAEFLADPRHHLAVALGAGQVIGMASAVHYLHPDKAPQLWINEVAVAPAHQSQGIGRRLLELLLAHGRTLGCTEAWVLTDDLRNKAAHALYASVGGQPSAEGSVKMYTRAELLVGGGRLAYVICRPPVHRVEGRVGNLLTGSALPQEWQPPGRLGVSRLPSARLSWFDEVDVRMLSERLQ